jgi:hypothetical protein
LLAFFLAFFLLVFVRFLARSPSLKSQLIPPAHTHTRAATTGSRSCADGPARFGPSQKTEPFGEWDSPRDSPRTVALRQAARSPLGLVGATAGAPTATLNALDRGGRAGCAARARARRRAVLRRAPPSRLVASSLAAFETRKDGARAIAHAARARSRLEHPPASPRSRPPPATARYNTSATRTHIRFENGSVGVPCGPPPPPQQPHRNNKTHIVFGEGSVGVPGGQSFHVPVRGPGKPPGGTSHFAFSYA